MMYAEPQNFEKDFIRRTQKIIRKLDDNKEPYDVTQFINSMLGLLIIPKEKYYSQITDSMIDENLLQEIRAKCRPAGDLQYIVRRVRNAVSHGKLKFKAEEFPDGTVGKEIKRVIFRDKKTKKRSAFTAKFEIDLLKKFVWAFSDAILELPD